MTIWVGHSTIIRRPLVEADYTALLTRTADGNPHYELAADITPIPVYHRVGNFGCHLVVSDIESNFNVSALGAAFGPTLHCKLIPIIYTIDNNTMLERPVFGTTVSGGPAVAYLKSITFGTTDFKTQMWHYIPLPSTDESATEYDPIAAVTFPAQYPGLIAQIGFAWVHQGTAGTNFTASVRIRGPLELTVP